MVSLYKKKPRPQNGAQFSKKGEHIRERLLTARFIHSCRSGARVRFKGPQRQLPARTAHTVCAPKAAF
jgi:hypothetical protein